MNRALAPLGLVSLLAFMAPHAHAASANSPLWAQLKSGPYRTGFKYIYTRDPSRTWTQTRGFGQTFSPDRFGRPIRISIWYPASPERGRRMVYRGYVDAAGPQSFKRYDALIRAQDLLHSKLNVRKGVLPQFLATPVNAYANAVPLKSRFPLVLYFDGLQGDTVSQVVLNEYLASYGFVVATIPIVGQDAATPAQTNTQAGLETTIRDMEFAWSILRFEPEVDASKVAVMGHSLGAVEAILFAMQNGDVSAVVGLDGTYGFTPDVLTNFYAYDPMRMSAAFLDLRRAQKDTGPSAFVLDLSAVNWLYFSDRTLVTLKGMYHTDFTDFGILAKIFDFPPFADRNYTIGSLGYQSVCRIVLDYLEMQIIRRPAAGSQFDADVASAPGGAARTIAALQLPPSPQQMVEVARKKGLTAATQLVQYYRINAPKSPVVNESVYNSLGYTLLAEKDFAGAIAALEIDSFAYPHSSNIADSLGDMYAGAGQYDKARQAYLRALALLPADSEQNAAGKRDLKQTLLQAIKGLPQPVH